MLEALALADPAARWEALGFSVDAGGRFAVGGVTLSAGAGAGARDRGIAGWTLRGVTGEGAIDGLPTTVAPDRPAPAGDAVHPNGAVAVDHVVVVTPAFDALAEVLDARGLALRRVRVVGGGRRQGFRRLGPAIMEIVEAPEAGATAFWGLTFTVADGGALDALAARLGPRLLGEPRDAVQPGRRIATVRGDAAGLTTAVAFMDPGTADTSE